jgi:hypothetical protein
MTKNLPINSVMVTIWPLRINFLFLTLRNKVAYSWRGNTLVSLLRAHTAEK